MAAGPAVNGTGQTDPRYLRNPATVASYRSLLANRNYRFWFLAALITSLGDWAGLFALQTFVVSVAETTRVELFSLGGIMMARLVPSLLIGPVAGVLADRYQRRRLMVIVDIARGTLFCVMAFSGDLVAIFALTMIIETLALLFLSAKDAMMPSLVEADELTQANQLNFLVTYGTLPLGAALAAAMVGLVALLPDGGITLDPLRTVLVVDGLTFFVSAMLVRGIQPPEQADRPVRGDEDAPGLITQVRDGLRAIADRPLVHALVTGVTGVFFGAGIIVAIGPVFVDRTLGRPEGDWFTMLTVVGAGLIFGIVSVPVMTNRFRIERVYPIGLVLTSLVATVLAVNSDWLVTLGLGAALGAAAGLTVVTGYTLLQAYTADESRGRTFAAFYTGSRVATFAALGLAPFLAGSIEVINIGISGTGDADAQFALSGTRITMLLGGLVALWFSQRSARAIWRAAGPTELGSEESKAAGVLIAFEGIEGAGKSTHARLLAEHLRARGYDVVCTREPGGTPVAEAVRGILLDGELDAMDDRTEALLYAAARAEHVAKVIAPALQRGAVVITDRYLDSSLAYQGHARGLGIAEVAEVNQWGTRQTQPDLVLLLALDVEQGLARVRHRVGDDGTIDRLEREAVEFHRRVAGGFDELARRSPDRFVVIAADGDIDDVAARVREVVDARLEDRGRTPDGEPDSDPA